MEENYLKLLDSQKELAKTGKFLSPEEKNELLDYEVRISDHFKWEQRSRFFETMVDFLKERIDLDQYIDRFYEMNCQIGESKEKLKSDFEKLRAFEPGFAGLMENLFGDLRVLEVDDELRTDNEISEESLINGIREFLPKVQKYL